MTYIPPTQAEALLLLLLPAAAPRCCCGGARHHMQNTADAAAEAPVGVCNIQGQMCELSNTFFSC